MLISGILRSGETSQCVSTFDTVCNARLLRGLHTSSLVITRTEPKGSGRRMCYSRLFPPPVGIFPSRECDFEAECHSDITQREQVTRAAKSNSDIISAMGRSCVTSASLCTSLGNNLFCDAQLIKLSGGKKTATHNTNCWITKRQKYSGEQEENNSRVILSRNAVMVQSRTISFSSYLNI
jgi:hypothetical protein